MCKSYLWLTDWRWAVNPCSVECAFTLYHKYKISKENWRLPFLTGGQSRLELRRNCFWILMTMRVQIELAFIYSIWNPSIGGPKSQASVPRCEETLYFVLWGVLLKRSKNLSPSAVRRPPSAIALRRPPSVRPQPSALRPPLLLTLPLYTNKKMKSNNEIYPCIKGMLTPNNNKL